MTRTHTTIAVSAEEKRLLDTVAARRFDDPEEATYAEVVELLIEVYRRKN